MNTKEIIRLLLDDKFYIISQIHPDWIMEKIKKERPQLQEYILSCLQLDNPFLNHFSPLNFSLKEQKKPLCNLIVKSLANEFPNLHTRNTSKFISWTEIPYMSGSRIELIAENLGIFDFTQVIILLNKEAQANLLSLTSDSYRKKIALRINRNCLEEGFDSEESQSVIFPHMDDFKNSERFFKLIGIDRLASLKWCPESKDSYSKTLYQDYDKWIAYKIPRYLGERYLYQLSHNSHSQMTDLMITKEINKIIAEIAY